VAAAILDRLLHHATVVNIKGRATGCEGTRRSSKERRGRLGSEQELCTFRDRLSALFVIANSVYAYGTLSAEREGDGPSV
jgi:hypothetical protein